MVLSALLLQALKLLKLLDQQLLRCSEDIEDLEGLEFEIEDETEEVTEIDTSVNGFTLAVVVDNKS